MPPFVTTRALRPAPASRSARASSRSLWPSSDSSAPYARAVSKTATPASTAAATVSSARLSSRSASVERRMHPRPTRSSSGASQSEVMPARRLARTLRADSPRPRARVELARGSGANGCRRTRPLASVHVPATNPSTRNVSATSPFFAITTFRYSSGKHARAEVVGEQDVVPARQEADRDGNARVGERRARQIEERSPGFVDEVAKLELLEPRLDDAERQSRPLREVGSARGAERGEVAPHEMRRRELPVGPVGSEPAPCRHEPRARRVRAPDARRRRADEARRVLRGRTRRATGGGSRARASGRPRSSSSSGRERGCSLASSAIRSPSSAKPVSSPSAESCRCSSAMRRARYSPAYAR